MYKKEEIKPVIHSSMGFTDLPAALELLENRKSYGKIIINVA
jgi:NADPH:quinone reductase-like Zn-dependent oxidoreductase